jgi:hypothetical protein
MPSLVRLEDFSHCCHYNARAPAETTYDVTEGCQVQCLDVLTDCGVSEEGQSCLAKCPNMTSCLSSGRQVWGSSNMYTDGSGMCRAAINAGVIPVTGGVVEVKKVSGQSSYTSDDENDVSTASWDSWTGSCSFLDV